jgi:hypothetical protein
MEYFLADRPPFKGGGVDEAAIAAEPLFTIGAGALAASVVSSKPGDLEQFQREGVSYTVKVFSGAQRTPAEIQGMLVTAQER